MARPGVLLAVSPGATRERLAVEAELTRRGWRCVAVPAEADLLVIVGDREAEESDWVANLWRAVPAPKAWVRLTDIEQISETFDHGLTELRRGEPVRPPGHSHHADHGGHDDSAGHKDHGGGDEAQGSNEEQDGHHKHGGDAHHAEHSAHDEVEPHPHDSHGHSGAPEGRAGHEDHHDGHDGHEAHDDHGGHEAHGGHDMGGVVDGLPMADRADDRDGLRLDRLHVPLGPALADWPAGLVLRLTLQGDVVQQVAVESTAPASSRPPFWNEPWLRERMGERVSQGDAARRLCAAHLDSLGRFFAVTGWADMAARARHVRDRALARAGAAELSALVRPLIRRAERSRTLRWLTAGLGPLVAEHARHLGVTGPALLADGDAHSRMLVWLDAVGRSAAACDDSDVLDAAEAVGPRGRIDGAAPPSQPLLDALPGLLKGAEFACARVIVASLDPDLDELASFPLAGVAHD
ncbi:hypothetical protein H8R17_02040 [Streptomyces sp. TRM68367]|nr:hypothetical protein [Streptomyces sp. TRM68367]